MDSRKRLYHWLKRNVEEGKYGLYWFDKERQLFAIPWVHKHNKKWNKEYCQVYKEWARFTNRFGKGEPEDWPGWKTRLRTALRKLPYFEEMTSLHNLEDPERPFKVYKFLPKDKRSGKDSPTSSQTSDTCSDATASPPYFDALSPNFLERNDLNVTAQTPTTHHSPGCEVPDQVMTSLPTEATGLVQGLVACSPQNNLNFPFLPPNFPVITGEQLRPVNPPTAGEDLESLPSADLVSLEPNALVPQSRLLSANSPPCLPQPPPRKPILEYKIFYIDELVREGFVYNEGTHFHFGVIDNPCLEDVYGPAHLERIQLPDVSSMKKPITSQQHETIESILVQMDRGFIFECTHLGDVYVQRLCRTRIFAKSQQCCPNSVCLDRKTKAKLKLFDKAKFMSDPSSSSDVKAFLTFAQDFPAEPFKKVMMHMELVHIEADDLKKTYLPPHVGNHKSGPQFSGFDSGDNLIHIIKDLQLTVSASKEAGDSRELQA